ncbi:orotate phosphoribosyltransferase [Calditrichota bacterium]
MDQAEIEQMLLDAGAFMTGHFLYASGLHGEVYIEKFRALENPDLTTAICEELISRAPKKIPRVVIGPLTGGALMAFEVARQIGAKAYFTEKIENQMELRRGFHIEPGEEVWITEDVVNLGGSIRDAVRCVEEAGAKIGAILVLVDRSKGRVQFDVPFLPLIQVTNLEEYQPRKCPLCKQGIPLIARGGRKVPSKS